MMKGDADQEADITASLARSQSKPVGVTIRATPND